MKGMIFGLFVLVAVTFAADDKKEGIEDGIKIYKRLIPADVLRGMLMLIIAKGTNDFVMLNVEQIVLFE
jgi:hypothetical protein